MRSLAAQPVIAGEASAHPYFDALSRLAGLQSFY